MTIIEKFENYSNVGYAVVLLTPDDTCFLEGEGRETHSSRARQNVIFELGFFIGKLGRSRVCSLYRENVELPSDYSGVTYIPYDQSGAWKLIVARELKQIGYSVDLNLLA